jgi:hypothetical protein
MEEASLITPGGESKKEKVWLTSQKQAAAG